MQEKLTYEQAMEKLEALAARLERGDVPIDEMAAHLKEAQQMIKYCRNQLYKADESVKRILSPDVAADGSANL